MRHLENISASHLRNVLDDVDDVHATKQLIVATAYKQGISQTDLAEWYRISRKTVYNWLQRFEAGAVRTAARDQSRPGHPPKLDCEQRFEVTQLLREPPANAGYNAEEWSIPLVQQLLDVQFDVTYSRTSVYRILSSIE